VDPRENTPNKIRKHINPILITTVTIKLHSEPIPPFEYFIEISSDPVSKKKSNFLRRETNKETSYSSS